MKQPTLTAVPVDDAKTWTCQWRKAQTPTALDESAQSFLVSMEDIKALADDPRNESVRIYMALKAVPNVPDAYQEGLVLVGVDANGLDRIDAGVWDLTTPCPPTCGDPNSVLATYDGCQTPT